MNQVILCGRLGNDPEQKGIVVKFNIATERNTKIGNAYEKTTDWHECNVFGTVADACVKFLKKGSKVLVVGHMESGKYNKDGKDVYTYQLKVDKVDFL